MPPRLVIVEKLGEDIEVETAAAAEYGVAVEARPGTDRDGMLRAAADAEAILLRLARVDADFIGACPNLRVIGRCGVGVDNIDVDAATARGIQVINVPDYCVEEVATHTAALLLAAWRRIPTAQGLARTGGWWNWDELSPIRPLSICSLGIVGFGRMGRAAVDIFGSWFEEVVFHDPAVADGSGGIANITLEELFGRCDVISLHCPSIPSTKRMVNAGLLENMRPDCLLINVARGDLVDEEALLAGLAVGRPSRVALDVLTIEPPDPEHPLLNHPAVLVTNHAAWLSTHSTTNVRRLLASRCARALLDLDAETVVNARALEATRDDARASHV